MVLGSVDIVELCIDNLLIGEDIHYDEAALLYDEYCNIVEF